MLNKVAKLKRKIDSQALSSSSVISKDQQSKNLIWKSLNLFSSLEIKIKIYVSLFDIWVNKFFY